ncbi:hypothetical protein ACF3NG_01875 [Aerococcaceae bacterium WGS1372]
MTEIISEKNTLHANFSPNVHIAFDRSVSPTRKQRNVTSITRYGNILKNDENHSIKYTKTIETESTIRLFVEKIIKKDIVNKVYTRDDDEGYLYIEIYNDDKSIEENLYYIDILNDEAMDRNLNYIFVLS